MTTIVSTLAAISTTLKQEPMEAVVVDVEGE